MSNPSSATTTRRVEVDGRRFYRNELLGDKLSPSVSTILSRTAWEDFSKLSARQAVTFALNHISEPGGKQAHINRALEEPRHLLNGAAHVGSVVHDLLWQPKIMRREHGSDVINALESWDLFLEESGARHVVDELEVTGLVEPGDTTGYGGTLDAIIQLPNEKRVLIDAKTSRNVHPANALQAAAYWGAYTGRVDEVWIVKLNKFYAEYEIHEVNVPQAWAAFKNAHQLFIRLNENLWL